MSTARRSLLGLSSLFLAAAAGLLAVGLWQRPGSGQPDESRTTTMPEHLVALRIEFAADQDSRRWSGSIAVSPGRILSSQVVRGGNASTAEGARFDVRAARRQNNQNKQREFINPVLLVRLDAAASAEVTIRIEPDEVRAQLSDLSSERRRFLDNRLTVQAENAALPLTPAETEDDHPAVASGPDGTLWLAYVEYQAGPPIDMAAVLKRDFKSLVPTGHGDRVRLIRFDGQTWHAPLDVTEGQLEVWRPAIAADGDGNVVVAWPQQVDGDWEIMYRRYAAARDGGAWSDTVRLTRQTGSDYYVSATTDADGRVWLAWQAWRDGRFRILVTSLDDQADEPRMLGATDANNWSPSIAADGKGNVYVAWDHYANENYDVELAVIGADGLHTMPVARSPRFEARAHVVCDSSDRVWVAYEEGDEQWGKDYQGDRPDLVGLNGNPGFGLYVQRTIQVKCLDGSRWKRPVADLQAAFSESMPRNRSVPLLRPDSEGGLWLLARHHLTGQGGGEAWVSYALRFDGARWSSPQLLPDSTNILDNRPAVAADAGGLLAVYSGDSRTNTRSRQQSDLYVARLNTAQHIESPQLSDVEPPAPASVEPFHPDEAEAVKRLREFRLQLGGRELRLLRGEFHRHTEFTAHRDQDGLLEDSLRYALDAGSLDWMGNGDHDNGFGHEYLWWEIQKRFDLCHNPPHFVAAMTYERSVVFPSGHRNVMFSERGIRPLPRLSGRDQLYGSEKEGAPDIKLLYDYLKNFGGICAIHTSGTRMGTDWRDNDPEVEPIVEIYQGHRHNYEHFGAPRSATEQRQIGGYQPEGFVWNALEKGYRLGFQSSSDHVSTHMSYAVVLVPDVSRSSIIDAFKKRHSYAATDNILLIVRSGEQLMGDEFETHSPPTLEITARGARPISKVDVIRDNRYVYSAQPNQIEIELEYTDMEAEPDETHYYYVRVRQEDGNLAWASPMRITYRK